MSYYNGSSYIFTWTGRQLTGAVKGSNTMSFTYNDEGIRTSKTIDGVKHTYHLNGSQIVAEEWEDKLLVYLYDAAGSPIGMMYRTASYAEGTWDTFLFDLWEKAKPLFIMKFGNLTLQVILCMLKYASMIKMRLN